MKTLLIAALVGIATLVVPHSVLAKDDLSKQVQNSIKTFKKTDPSMEKFFKDSAGYAVFPRVAKGGLGIGAAHGKGEVFEKGKLIGSATLSQGTIGFQLGGQVFSEVIFFETGEAMEDFKGSKMKMNAQVGAIAAAEGVSKNARYQHGVAVFTIAINGLMFEASVGGQKFKFTPKE